MAFFRGPNIVTDGLVLCLDAANTKSYPESGTTWKDLSGGNYDFTLDESGITHNSNGYFALADGGATLSSNITDNNNCTMVFWIKTTDTQALFWGAQSGGYYLGAYRSGNKFYNGNMGSPTFHMDTEQKSNIYDNLRTGNWHMCEFKSVDFSTTTDNRFNQYGGYTFGNGQVGMIMMYDRNLTSAESTQNFNAIRSRFGI